MKDSTKVKLQEVADAIRQQPEHFDMYTFLRFGVVEVPGKEYMDDDNPVIGSDKKLQAVCGTTCCIAGWIVALDGQNLKEGRIESRATAIIDDDSIPLHHLFYAEDFWPHELSREYYHQEIVLNDKKAAAEIAAKHIEHFIATEGVDEE